jgi:hypothetical protein
MSDSDVRERPGQTPRAAGPVFDLVVSKLRRLSDRGMADARLATTRHEAITRAGWLGLR